MAMTQNMDSNVKFPLHNTEKTNKTKMGYIKVRDDILKASIVYGVIMKCFLYTNQLNTAVNHLHHHNRTLPTHQPRDYYIHLQGKLWIPRTT